MQFGPNAQRFVEHDLFQKSATRSVQSILWESLEALLLLQTTYELDITKLIHGAFKSTNQRYEVPSIPMENKERLILEVRGGMEVTSPGNRDDWIPAPAIQGTRQLLQVALHAV